MKKKRRQVQFMSPYSRGASLREAATDRFLSQTIGTIHSSTTHDLAPQFAGGGAAIDTFDDRRIASRPCRLVVKSSRCGIPNREAGGSNPPWDIF